MIFLAGGVLEGASKRQHSTAVDVAAAEAYAASVAAAVLVCIVGTTAFASFGVLGNERVRMWCDNTAAVAAGNDAASIKRLAYIARRVRFLQELVTRGIMRLYHVAGNVNPADAMTKHIAPKALFQEYMARAYNCSAADIVARASVTALADAPAKQEQEKA